MNGLRVYRAKTWAAAKRKLLELVDGKEIWIFRGQRDSSWPLCTSLERAIPSRYRLLVEHFMLREFKRRAFHYLGAEELPRDAETMEWLAIMQHHGTPTRLLDFTLSPYVAAFFALESAFPQPDGDEYCAVWAVDELWCRDKGLQRLRTASLLKSPPVWNPDYLHAVFSSAAPGVFPVRPFRMNDRLSAQQGLFLLPGDHTMSFESNLESYFERKPTNRVWKIEIPKTARCVALSELTLMNVNKGTLFPGMDGFLQSLIIDAENAFEIKR